MSTNYIGDQTWSILLSTVFWSCIMEPKQCLQWKRISSGQQIVSCIYSPKHNCRFKIVSHFIQFTCSCLWVPKGNSTQHNNLLYKPFHCPEQRCSQDYKKIKSFSCYNLFTWSIHSLWTFSDFASSCTNPLDPSFPIWWIAPPPPKRRRFCWLACVNCLILVDRWMSQKENTCFSMVISNSKAYTTIQTMFHVNLMLD